MHRNEHYRAPRPGYPNRPLPPLREFHLTEYHPPMLPCKGESTPSFALAFTRPRRVESPPVTGCPKSRLLNPTGPPTSLLDPTVRTPRSLEFRPKKIAANLFAQWGISGGLA